MLFVFKGFFDDVPESTTAHLLKTRRKESHVCFKDLVGEIVDAAIKNVILLIVKKAFPLWK